MTWKCDDRTELDLGGEVRGASAFAYAIRVGLASKPLVHVAPIPSEPVELDVRDESQLGQWLRDMARVHGRTVVSGPKPETVPAAQGVAGRVY